MEEQIAIHGCPSSAVSTRRCSCWRRVPPDARLMPTLRRPLYLCYLECPPVRGLRSRLKMRRRQGAGVHLAHPGSAFALSVQ